MQVQNPEIGRIQLSPQLSLRTLLFYQSCDHLSGYFIYLMLVFSPWAFGTTQPWSIWTMNALGYGLGALWLLKLGIRFATGYIQPRWDRAEGQKQGTSHAAKRARALIRALGVVSFLVLAYCLIGAINCAAVYLPGEMSFTYSKYIPWLPHSYDGSNSWNAFWKYLAIALSFWAIRDWLVGKSVAEQVAERGKAKEGACQPTSFLPQRLRHLLWVLAINGGLLALEGIIQRLSGIGELLFLVQPQVHPQAMAQFGPYAYRSNAAQYFNMAWPAALALWWMLSRGGRKRLQFLSAPFSHHLLLGCAALMAICPIISASRAGAAVAGVNLLVAGVVLWSALRREDKTGKVAIALFAGVVIAVGLILGGGELMNRMDSESLDRGFTLRNSMYELANPMAEQHPVFGTGAGTFDTLFQMYRFAPEEYWPVELHNDWLETLITFGMVGISLLLAALALVLARWFIPGGVHGGRRMVILFWLSLAGCLGHARWDFPFQIYSTLFLFVVLCAILSLLSRQASR